MANITIRADRLPTEPTIPDSVAPWLLPDLPEDEYQWIDTARGAVRVPRPTWASHTPASRAGALALVPTYRALCQPVTRAHLAVWLGDLRWCRDAPSAEAFPDAVATYARFLSTLAVGVFTAATQEAAGRTFDFFPTPARVHEFLIEDSRRLKRTLGILEYLGEST